MITRVKEIGKENKQPLMKNGPIFVWRPGNFILDGQEGKDDFYDLIHDLQNHHNDDNDSNYVPDDSGEYDDSLDSCES